MILSDNPCKSRDFMEGGYDLFYQVPDALLLLDPNTEKVLDYNGQAIELFEVSVTETLIGSVWHNLCRYPCSPDEMYTLRGYLKKHGTWIQDIEYKTEKGNIFWGNSAIKRIQIKDQLFTLVRIIDITEQKELERELKHSNNKLRYQELTQSKTIEKGYQFQVLLNKITQSIRSSLNEKKILKGVVEDLGYALNAIGCNAALYNLEQGTSTIQYEYSQSLVHRKGDFLWMKEFPDVYESLLAGRSLIYCPIVPSKTDLKIQKIAYPIQDEIGILGDLWLVFNADYDLNEQELLVVEQVANQCGIALRQALLFQTAQDQVLNLKALNHLKDDFIATISHELRTPLTTLRMALRLINLSNSEEKRQHYYETAMDACERQIELVNDLLDIQSLESQQFQLTETLFCVNDWIQALIASFQQEAEQKHLILKLDPLEKVIYLKSDQFCLTRILKELIENAIKYTSAGGQILIQIKKDNRDVIFWVKNSGHIEPHELPRIFDRFYRIPTSDPWRYSGTGLGLALVKQLVKHLKGDIVAMSTTGWITFEVRIPQAVLEEEVRLQNS